MGARWLTSVRKRRTFVTRLAIVGAATLFFVAVCLLAQQKQSPQATSAALDKMIAAKKSQKELAQYVFDNHGCKSCHTVGENGKLGFTEKGKRLTNGFEGCIRTLTAIDVMV